MRPDFNILLIDDDDDDRLIFLAAVSEVDASIGCYTASDGLAGLNLLDKENTLLPDIIFLDLNMPRLDGKQFLMERNKRERLRSIPVVVFSTTKRQEDIAVTKALGAFDFITKPVKYKDICDEINNVLNKVRSIALN